MKMVNNGQFWMRFWIVVFIFMITWGVLTFVFWWDSTRNINALSAAANILAPMAGCQAALSMRKADNHDKF